MKPEHAAILVECYRRERRHEQTPQPPEWQYWHRRPYDEAVAHGPEYSPSEWFGAMANHERQRLLRGITDLEQGGLLVTWSRWGRRLSHVKLTAEGERIALELLRADRLERRRAGR